MTYQSIISGQKAGKVQIRQYKVGKTYGLTIEVHVDGEFFDISIQTKNKIVVDNKSNKVRIVED